MKHKVRVTIELLNPDTDEVLESLSAARYAKVTGVHPEGWPAVCTAREAFEEVMLMTAYSDGWNR